MRLSPAVALVLVTIPCLVASGPAVADWPQWRGPSFDGTTDDTNLPVTWTKTENIAWATASSGPSAATPSVAGDRVFVTALDRESMDVLALGLDRKTGKVLWKHAVGKGQPGPRDGFENSRAECSPVSDGAIVCFLFGNGVLTAFDLDGARLWRRDLVEEFGSLRIQWGYASSPLLYDGVLYVQVLRSGESFLLAVAPQTGETLWRHIREDEARAESEQAYTTPMPFDNAGRKEILVLGADCITSHDPKTGREHWRWSGLNPNDRGNFRVISNAVAGPDGFIYVTSPQGNPLHAIKVEGDSAKEVWTLRRPTPDVCTPLYYRNRLYVIDGRRRRRMACLNPTTGERFWEEELKTPTYVRSSPTAADGKIYVMDAEGFINVIAAGDEFRVLGQIPMDSYPSRANIAIDDGQLLIRTADQLYCVGKGVESGIGDRESRDRSTDQLIDGECQGRMPSSQREADGHESLTCCGVRGTLSQIVIVIVVVIAMS